MRKDDVIKSIRYTLNIGDGEIAEILKLAGYKPTREEIAYIFEEAEEGKDKIDITHEMTAYFLDGLIYYKRGKSDKHPQRPIQTPVTNNMVMKKLRVAFTLREDDIQKIINKAGFDISASELNALFRNKNHRNYQPAGDQVLRYFLKGLAMTYRKE
ncbi:MAG: DUF1456 family protein [Balneolaceae bacterium]|nr:MAG: DUF1456 family protein [Balneolaceae bacterium]